MTIFVQIVSFLSLALLAHVTSKAMVCYINQEPDPDSNQRYRWVIPVEDPCQCTEIQLGGMSTHTPCRPFNVTYYDTFLHSNNLQEIQQWLKCYEITCATRDLVFPKKGVMTNCSDNHALYGTTCTLYCNHGYEPKPSVQRTCLSDSNRKGVWSTGTFSCKKITCALRNLLTNVVKSNCTRKREPYGTNCTLSCNRGYTPTTSVQRTCQSNSSHFGVWSAGTISCTIVTCPPLSVPIHGRISSCVRNGQTRSTAAQQPFDTSCAFSCNEGYTLIGSAYRTCLIVNSTWDGNDTHCADVTAPVLTCPFNRNIFSEKLQNVIYIPWSDWEPVKGTDAGHDIPAVLKTINSSPVTADSKPTTLEYRLRMVYTATDSAGNSASCSMQIWPYVRMCLGLQTLVNGLIRLVAGHGSCTEGTVWGSQCEISCEFGYALSTRVSTLTLCERYPINNGAYMSWTIQESKLATCVALSSCRAYIETGQSHGNGYYKIFPHCIQTSYEPMDVYCDQESNGGGWMRFYYKSGPKTCFNYNVTWTADLISCLGLDTQITSFAVSDNVTTINRENSWILEGSLWEEDTVTVNVSHNAVIANLANCKTPSCTDWSQDYEDGFMHFYGILSTNGNWQRMYIGCDDEFIHVGNESLFRFGGSPGYKGEFINIDMSCASYDGTAADRSPKSLWDTDNVRAMWIKT